MINHEREDSHEAPDGVSMLAHAVTTERSAGESHVPPNNKRPVERCRKCGIEGVSGNWPFTTLAGQGICDDCEGGGF